jgi:hypothetical protein
MHSEAYDTFFFAFPPGNYDAPGGCVVITFLKLDEAARF